ncbi:cochlin [Cynoglossus semilaevis]|uniref:Cochlin n=1 Tax=Cynoglossus semilaevis TaxID=244447 RepID=A0A3P8VYM4_CYNSE|nr:cochlin [Cynoglossus semilaevis]
MSLLQLTGHLLFIVISISSTFASESTVPYPITCETRGVDLKDDVDVVLCPPDCTQGRVSVFGTGIYASISSVCGAAVHRGVLRSSGGPVKIHKQQGRKNYISSHAHGIQSQSLVRWSSSFTLTKPVTSPQELTSDGSATVLPPMEQPAAKKESKVKKPSVKKALTGGNRECQVDLAMVLDSSKNIGQRRFNLQKNFVSKLAAMMKVGSTGPHVGLVQASDLPKTEIFLTNYTQPKELLFAIKELSYMGGNSNTGKAIKHTAQTFFQQENGGRRGHPRVMLVLVDGWPSDDLEQAATYARESGINVFLVSVAKPVPEEVTMVQDKDFAKKAVCKDNSFFSHQITSWFSTTKHVKPLSQKLCSTNNMLCSKTCYNSVNIAFLIDGSSSVGDTNFRLMLDFMTGIVRSFEISDMGSRVGVVQFTYEQRTEIGLSDYTKKEDALNALQNIRYMSGGTATGAAITYTADMLFKNTGPGRNFMILVTDGQSYDEVIHPAEQARNQGITFYSVGVAWAPHEDLKAMASEPKDSHMFFSREFTGLSEFVEPIVKGICRDFTEKN